MPAEAKVNWKDKRIIVENVRRVLLKEYLMNETRRAGFGGLDIQRTPMGTRVTLLAERPGLVIGRKGGAIKALTEAVEQRFRFDNPQIEVQEVASPALNAQIMAEKLANALERAADHGGRCEGVPRRDRRQAHRPAASDGEIQGGPHQVLRRAAEPLDGPRLRVREVEARDHRRHGRNHGSTGEAARRGGDQEADGRIPRRRSGRGARTDSGTGAVGR